MHSHYYYTHFTDGEVETVRQYVQSYINFKWQSQASKKVFWCQSLHISPLFYEKANNVNLPQEPVILFLVTENIINADFKVSHLQFICIMLNNNFSVSFWEIISLCLLSKFVLRFLMFVIHYCYHAVVLKMISYIT